MKKLLSTLLLMLAPVLASAYDAKINGIYYNFNTTDKTAEVTYQKFDFYSDFESDYSGDITIPSEVNYNDGIYSVTSIGKSAFYGCSGLTSITIPDGVTSIGWCTFYGCSGLTSINIPDGVTSIDDFAFQGCSALTSINIPDGLTRISDCVFQGCSGLISIIIPDGVTHIGPNAFRDCNGLISIIIPDGVTSIGNCAFYGCNGLTTITIGKSLKEIKGSAFSNCTNLEEVYIYAENFLSSPSNIFNNTPINQSILYAPAIHLNSYRTSSPWSNFKYIFPIEGSYAERCAKPTINIKDGEIVFECETPDASYVTSYELLNSSNTTDNKMTLPNLYRISVYAQKYGLLDSPVATIEVEMTIGKRGDLNNDGVTNAADVVKLTDIIMNHSNKE